MSSLDNLTLNLSQVEEATGIPATRVKILGQQGRFPMTQSESGKSVRVRYADLPAVEAAHAAWLSEDPARAKKAANKSLESRLILMELLVERICNHLASTGLDISDLVQVQSPFEAANVG